MNDYYYCIPHHPSRIYPLSNLMRLENGDYIQLCYLDFMPLPMCINTGSSLLCNTLRVYPQFNVSASLCVLTFLGPFNNECIMVLIAIPGQPSIELLSNTSSLFGRTPESVSTVWGSGNIVVSPPAVAM